MRLALHACCGPCLIEPYDALVGDAATVTVVYANPNIRPAEEYDRRLATLRHYAESIGAEVIELPYDVETWEAQVGVHGQDAEQRCRACYRLRLGMVSAWASEHGYEAVATTLTVSPYQDARAIAEEGRRAAGRAGLEYLDRDFRDRYRQASARSREMGMYRQNYCGCALSEQEARRDREERRAARRAARTSEGGQD